MHWTEKGAITDNSPIATPSIIASYLALFNILCTEKHLKASYFQVLAIASIVSLFSDLSTSANLKWIWGNQAILAIQLFPYKNGVYCVAILAIQLFSLFKAHDTNLKLFWLFSSFHISCSTYKAILAL